MLKKTKDKIDPGKKSCVRMKGQVFPLSRSISINPVVHYIIVFLGLQVSGKQERKTFIRSEAVTMS